MNRTVLVTGGAGFIGSHFVKLLLTERPTWTVINLDLLTYAGSRENLVEGHARHRFVSGDIVDSTLVNDLLSEGVDTIVNLAAESHVDRSIQDPAPFVRTNVLGVQVLLDGALRHGVRRFVQVSTDEVYGSLGPSGLFHEPDPLAPSSPYAASKASADLLVSACVRTHGISASITRGTNTFGPAQHPEKFIPVCIIHALRGEDLPLYGDGLYTRDWMYVEDHCRAILSVTEEGANGRIYNVGANQELLNTDLARLILRKLAIPEDRIRLVSDRPGHDRRYGTDSSRIQEELGWSPCWTLGEGLDPTIDWYRARAHR